MTPNIIITGFMGTGKSSVGPRVAAILGRPFVDLDDLIATYAECDIETIFERWGEVGFRQREAAVVDEVAAQEGLVIATGGGTLVSTRNRRALARTGIVICLDATPDVPEARLIAADDEQPQGRPLLLDPDWRERLRSLLARRAHAYRQIPYHVDTSNLNEGKVAAEVLQYIETLQLEVDEGRLTKDEKLTSIEVQTPNGNYPIYFGSIADVGTLWQRQQLGNPVAIVTNTTIGELFGLPVQADLAVAGIPSTLIEVPDGEQFKSLATAATLYDALLARGIDRTSAIVALGGGVIGDMAGFVAATYMRGVPCVQVPTSLLAMVDSSVGGKVAVDHPNAKNLIGAFKQPNAVLMDSAFLVTLPAREIRNGLAEALKHGIISDSALFELLEQWGRSGLDDVTICNGPPGGWDALITQAVQVKVDIVQRDPYERSERAKLNLGHTFGHAYEVLSDFTLAHGEAVSVGIVTAARLSEQLGIAERGLAARIEAALMSLGLPTTWPGTLDTEMVWNIMQGDKKKAGAGLRFVLPRTIGDVVITEPGEVAKADVVRILEAMGG